MNSGRNHGQSRNAWLLHGLVIGVIIGIFVYFLSRSPQQTPALTATAITASTLAIPIPIAATATMVASSTQDGPYRLEIGQPAPEFTLPSLDGDEISLADYRGQSVLINFWASWCPPCRLEMTDLIAAYERHKNKGFVVLAINLTSQDSLPEVEAFVEEFGLTFPVLLDEEGAVTTDQFRLIGLPMSVFVNREGVITRVHIGAMTSEQVNEFVAELVRG